MKESLRKLPLEGIHILDFTWVFAGPTATLVLAALGAEVVKVETRKRPDLTRRFRHYEEGVPQPPSGGSFDGLNFGKKSVALDLSQPEAIALAKRLVEKCDVVVENFSYGVMDKFGLGYKDLCEIKPDIIMLSFSLFGREGPDKELFGFGGPLPVYTGLGSITGYPGLVPRTIGASWPDPQNGIAAAFALLAALHHHRRTGQGQYIDLSMSEGNIVTLPNRLLDYVFNKRLHGPIGNHDDFMVPHSAYRCRGEDQWVTIAVATENEWQSFCRVVGRPEWIEDPRFADRLTRMKHQDELDALIQEWTQQRTNYEVMHAMQAAGIAAGPTLNRKELLGDPHLKERGAFVQITENAGTAQRPVAAIPWRLSGVPHYNYGKPPMLGEQSKQVLCELVGLSEQEYNDLVERKVIF